MTSDTPEGGIRLSRRAFTLAFAARFNINNPGGARLVGDGIAIDNLNLVAIKCRDCEYPTCEGWKMVMRDALAAGLYDDEAPHFEDPV